MDPFVISLHPYTWILLFRVLPYFTAFMGLVLLFIIGTMPRSLKALVMSWISRRPATLALMFNDDGRAEVEKITSQLGQGIFETREGDYLIKNRPANLSEKDEKKISSKEKALMDDWIQYKHFTEWGAALLVGYVGKSIIVPAKVLDGIEIAEAERSEVNLLDPRKIKTYFRKTISPAVLNSIKFTNRQIGFYMRPELEALKQGGPIIGIIILIFAAYLLLSGKIPIPSVLGG